MTDTNPALIERLRRALAEVTGRACTYHPNYDARGRISPPIEAELSRGQADTFILAPQKNTNDWLEGAMQKALQTIVASAIRKKTGKEPRSSVGFYYSRGAEVSIFPGIGEQKEGVRGFLRGIGLSGYRWNLDIEYRDIINQLDITREVFAAMRGNLDGKECAFRVRKGPNSNFSMDIGLQEKIEERHGKNVHIYRPNSFTIMADEVQIEIRGGRKAEISKFFDSLEHAALVASDYINREKFFGEGVEVETEIVPFSGGIFYRPVFFRPDGKPITAKDLNTDSEVRLNTLLSTNYEAVTSAANANSIQAEKKSAEYNKRMNEAVKATAVNVGKAGYFSMPANVDENIFHFAAQVFNRNISRLFDLDKGVNAEEMNICEAFMNHMLHKMGLLGSGDEEWQIQPRDLNYLQNEAEKYYQAIEQLAAFPVPKLRKRPPYDFSPEKDYPLGYYFYSKFTEQLSSGTPDLELVKFYEDKTFYYESINEKPDALTKRYIEEKARTNNFAGHNNNEGLQDILLQAEGRKYDAAMANKNWLERAAEIRRTIEKSKSSRE